MTKRLCVLGLVITTFLTSQLMAFAGDLLGNNTFDDNVGLPWHVDTTSPGYADFRIENGKYYVQVLNPENSGDPWDVQFRHGRIEMQSGHTYTVNFTVTADKNCKIYARIGDEGEPYSEYWNIGNNWETHSLTANEPWTCTETFIATRDEKFCEFTFHIGGTYIPVGTTFIFDDIYLEDPLYNPTPTQPLFPTPEDIRVNQLGYYPDMTKKATLLSDSETSLDWKLLDTTGKAVDEGVSDVFGFDEDSGDYVHIIDFSKYSTEGTGYKLVSGKSESHPFDISEDIYSDLKYDALKYFYLQRSGIEIKMPFCDKQEWSRAAGDPKDIVSCESPNINALNLGWAPYSSNHSLDVTGGWYFGGNHGKSTVEGGVAVWTLQNLYERLKYNDKDSLSHYGDGKLNIPESGNSSSDILDEARYQLEFMLSMQVPAGNPRAGMYHYRVEDSTVMGVAGPITLRQLRPPTTESTLNVAAVAAQGSRLWKDDDPDFAQKCIEAAEAAWDAAVANPDIFIPGYSATYIGSRPPFGYAEDDFYWAGCELYAATGKDKYLSYIKNSHWYLEVPTLLEQGSDIIGSFDMNNTHSLGTLTLALVPTGLPEEDIQEARNNIKAAANFYVDLERHQGYGIPYQQCDVEETLFYEGYPLNSNYLVLNNAIIMAYAFDYSKYTKYLNGALEAMDYILGRNPNVKSYITGYGDNPVLFPYITFFGNQAQPESLSAPSGIIVGGPNSGLYDPVVRGAGMRQGLPPQKCYMDNSGAWSVNGSLVAWNASLVWMSGYFDDGKATEYNTLEGPDINGDGRFNSTDYVVLRRHILGVSALLGSQRANADVNYDGKINSTDYSLMRRVLLGTMKW